MFGRWLSTFDTVAFDTPASRATLAELAFPLSAMIVGVVALGASPTPSQWLGFVILLTAVVGLALHEQRSSHPSVAVPDDAREAVVKWCRSNLRQQRQRTEHRHR